MLYVLICLSGTASLIYQVIWQRLLGLFTGSDVSSVSLVAAIFMIGLGLGSYLGGKISLQVEKRIGFVKGFAICELCIALMGFASKPFLYDFLYLRYFHHGIEPVPSLLVVFIAGLFPTVLMGISLPLLSKAQSLTIPEAIDRTAKLYFCNTLGAAMGAALASFYLIGQIGYSGSIMLASLLNLVCFILAWFTKDSHKQSTNRSNQCADTSTEQNHIIETKVKGGSVLFWCGVYFCSGFIALGLEIIWFRLLNVMLKANSMTFGWLLFLYLGGFALGIALGRLSFTRKHSSKFSYALLQSIIVCYSICSITFLVNTLGANSNIQPVFDFLARYNPVYFDSENIPIQQFLMVYVGVPIFFIVPPTILMGISFCVLQNLVHSSLDWFENRIGALQASNIFGSALGSMLVGLVGLEIFGTSGMLRTLNILGLMFLVWAILILVRQSIKTSHQTKAFVLGVSLCFGYCFVTLPTGKSFWAKLHGQIDDTNFIVNEDKSGVSAFCSLNKDGSKVYTYVNGQGHSELPYPGELHSCMGLLVNLHPKPENICIIGLGSADTLYCAGSNQNTKRIDCFEILKPEWKCLSNWNEAQKFKPLTKVFTDSRINIVFGDAREKIREGEKYDVIQGDPVRPFDSGAGFINSLQFFQLLKDRLKPGGIVIFWSSTPRTRTTFIKAFPHCIEFGAVLIGSNQTFSPEKEEILKRYSQNRITNYFESTGIDDTKILAETLNSYLGVAQADKNIAGLNLDLFPRDEYFVPLLK